jgi:hypothetical protein
MVGEVALCIADTVDVLCLPQASMALARTAVQAKLDVPVLTSPERADARLKVLLSEEHYRQSLWRSVRQVRYCGLTATVAVKERIP